MEEKNIVLEARQSLGLTQTAMADLLGKRPRIIQYYESDPQKIPTTVSKFIAYLLKEKEMKNILQKSENNA